MGRRGGHGHKPGPGPWGEWDRATADIVAVRTALTGGQILKVIIESAVLTPEQIFCACRAAEAAGADFVKSSTGFHPAGAPR